MQATRLVWMNLEYSSLRYCVKPLQNMFLLALKFELFDLACFAW